MPSASGTTVKLVGMVSCSSKKSGLNPERKLLPGSTVVVEAEETDCHLSKADSGDHAKPALLISARGTKGADELSTRKGAGAHVIRHHSATDTGDSLPSWPVR